MNLIKQEIVLLRLWLNLTFRLLKWNCFYFWQTLILIDLSDQSAVGWWLLSVGIRQLEFLFDSMLNWFLVNFNLFEVCSQHPTKLVSRLYLDPWTFILQIHQYFCSLLNQFDCIRVQFGLRVQLEVMSREHRLKFWFIKNQTVLVQS